MAGRETLEGDHLQPSVLLAVQAGLGIGDNVEDGRLISSKRAF